MKRKQIVDLITAASLILVGSILLIFPLVKVLNVKYVFIGVLAYYGLMNLTQFILTSDSKDYEGLFTMFASIIVLVILGFLDVTSNPLNLALTLFLWVIMMSLIKLKKSDYYHDRKKRLWILRIITLILFVIVGLLSVINLYYDSATQIIVLGYFYFVHGILELVDPISNILIED